MKNSNPRNRRLGKKDAAALLSTWVALTLAAGCSSDRVKNRAMESAAQYWQDKAYPGKSFDVQVVEAEKTDDGQYRVKGIVDGETRVGTYNPETENFSEGYYSLAHEREKRIAELEQESKYWKERADSLDKENYKLKVQLAMLRGDRGADDSGAMPASVRPSDKSVAAPPAGPGAAVPPSPPAAPRP